MVPGRRRAFFLAVEPAREKLVTFRLTDDGV